METVLNGHSGCQVTYNDNAVIKRANGYPLERLEAQIKKHDFFYYNNRDTRIQIPKIYEKYEDGYKMQFIRSTSTIGLLTSITTTNLDKILETLLAFIKTNTKDTVVDVTEQIYLKYLDIQQKINSEWLEDKFDELHQTTWVPAGYCHGDLTLDNILCSEHGNIALIDFLDSYIESPIQDLVKLRQDTKYRWVLHRHNIKCNKIELALNYLDKNIGPTPPILDLINLARIIPYSNVATQQFLKDAICNI